MQIRVVSSLMILLTVALKLESTPGNRRIADVCCEAQARTSGLSGRAGVEMRSKETLRVKPAENCRWWLR
ncbi:hypothetical protein KC19_6G171000 [Ceratodon purpureus]|uniref:Secreted protein n=1 Tax=Ceratodon purpureus TaxID=3225 RepID=A0A8T0HHZ7_CERPU|nr:hypothetical protein KC19_6G171000 [Ceratodon purpureus]